MSPTNVILLSHICPTCERASILRVRTHVAASFHGDTTGPFSDRVYRLGERMRWWPGDQAWRFEGEPNQPCGHAIEACAGVCDRCQGAVYAVVHFVQLVPVEVLDVAAAQGEPMSFTRTRIRTRVSAGVA
jgi:hypothetical protein